MTAATAPATIATSITPHDTNQLAAPCRAVYIGGAGDLAVTMSGGGDVTFSGLAAGTVLPIKPSVIKATGTTATLILAIA